MLLIGALVCTTVISIWPLPPAGWLVLIQVPTHLPLMSTVGAGWVLAQPTAPRRMTERRSRSVRSRTTAVR